jgi:dipeptidyl aminopeptidase/acylaminoacyl peptidase
MKKQLTPDNVTVGGKTHSQFVPEQLEQIQFWGDKPVYVKNNDIICFGKKKPLCSLLSLNKALQEIGLKTVAKMPEFIMPKPQQETIIFLLPDRIIFYSKGKILSQTAWKKSYKNRDYCSEKECFAFTQNQNLYINTKGKKIKINPSALTNVVYGQVVYRNEFGTDKGTFWSPKGNYLAFYRMDESMVSDYVLIDSSKNPPKERIIKYPSAGEKSHRVSIGIFSTKTKEITYLTTDDDFYHTNLVWTPDEKELLVTELNRAQNQLKLKAYHIRTGKVRSLFPESAETYIEPENPPFFISPTQFIWQSKRTGHNHLYLYDLSGKLLKPLTEGNFEVLSIDGFNPKSNQLFYTSNQHSVLEKNCYSLNLQNGKSTLLSSEYGWHETKVSPSGNYLLDSFSSIDIPRKINLIHTEKRESVNLLTAKNPYENYQTPEIEYGTLTAADNETTLHYRLTLPLNFDQNKKYPVIVQVYGGPHVQMVQNTWLGGGRGWELYWAQLGFVCFSLDNRGSANRGKQFEEVLYKNIGKAPLQDQIQGIEFLHTLPFVDKDRMGVYGWSFGGFMATQLMLKTEFFKIAVAGGSVIDWRLYEIMYTERYMQTPAKNPEGYAKNDLTQFVQNLNGKLLLIHCELDPVVRIINTQEFLSAAQKAKKPVDFYYYKKQEHNVAGKERVDLLERITTYLQSL